MSGRILMATVAALALAIPAVAQDQPKPPLATGQDASQPLQAEDPGQDQGAPAGAAEQGGAPAPPPMTAEEPTAAPADQELTAEEPATPPADMTFLEVQEEAQFLADEEVIGREVVNITDEQVGTIADLVIDPEQKLVGVVLAVGGFLGLGEKWVAVPVDQIQFPAADQPARLLVEVTAEQLENAPDFVTRAAVEAQRAAEQAQRQAMQQQQQIPSPGTTNQ